MKQLMRTTTILYLITLLLILTLDACVHEPLQPTGTTGPNPEPEVPEEEPCDPNIVYFENEVLPLLVSNCAKSGCHDPASAQDGVVLNSYQAIMNSDVVDAGDAGDSELYEKITENDQDDVMPPPPANRLTSQQISIIRNWINQGAKNTVCATEACDTTSVKYATHVSKIITNKCVGCHSGSVPSGNLNFSTHGGLQTVALNGRLMGAVTHASGYKPMPQGGNKLSTCEINTIRIWIDAGAPNN